MQSPDAELRNIRIETLSLTSAELVLDVEVHNPNGIALPIGAIDYDLKSRQVPLIAGRSVIEQTVPATQSRTVAVPLTLVFADLLSAAQQFEPGEVIPYRADLTVTLGQSDSLLRVPLEYEGELPIPALPNIRVHSVSWSQLDWTLARGMVELRVINPNAFGVTIQQMDYRLKLANVTVARSRVDGEAELTPDAAAAVRIPVELRPMDVGLAVFNVLQGDDLSYALEGDLRVATPYGPIGGPYRQAGVVGAP